MPYKDPLKKKESDKNYNANLTEEQLLRKRELTQKWWLSLKGKYSSQKYNAKKRGIEFILTYEEWLKIWEDSGHLDERSANGYCMCRFKDEGPYAVGNVYIALASCNKRDAWLNNKTRLPNTGQFLKDILYE